MKFHFSLSECSGVEPKSICRVTQLETQVILSHCHSACLKSPFLSYPLLLLRWKLFQISPVRGSCFFLLPNDPNNLWIELIVPSIPQVPNLVGHKTLFPRALFRGRFFCESQYSWHHLRKCDETNWMSWKPITFEWRRKWQLRMEYTELRGIHLLRLMHWDLRLLLDPHSKDTINISKRGLIQQTLILAYQVSNRTRRIHGETRCKWNFRKGTTNGIVRGKLDLCRSVAKSCQGYASFGFLLIGR